VTDVIWSSEGECSARNNTELIGPSLKCERVRTQNGLFYVETFKDISVAISYGSYGPYIRTMLQVTNRSGRTVKFDPNESQVDIYIIKSSYLKAKDTESVSKFITPDDAKARYIKYQSDHRSYIPFSLATLPPAPEPKNQVHTKTSSENAQTTKVTNDVSSTPDVRTESRSVSVQSTVPSANPQVSNGSKLTNVDLSLLPIFDYALTASHIADQQKAGGYVFFQPVKEKIRYLVFRIKIGDLVFVFPEETDKDKRKLAKKK